MADFRRFLMDGALNRRDFVKRAAALGLAVPAVGTILAACGGDDDDDNAATPTTGGSTEPTATTQITAPVTPTPGSAAQPTATTGQTAAATATTAAPATATTSSGTPKAGGKAVFLRTDEADLYDPVLNDANTVIWLIFNVYETLVKSNKNSDGLEPHLAESWETSDDGLTVTFNVRQGVKFSDGSDLTTDDIIFSLTRARDSETSAWSFTMVQVSDITAPDDKTVVLTLSEPWAPLLAGIAMFNCGVVSKAFFDANATDVEVGRATGEKGLTGPSCGTGPFAITEWKTDQYTILTKNEHYWQEGLPYLDEIKIMQVPDTNNEILQIQGGDVDGLIGQYSVPFNRVAELQKDSNLQVLVWPASYSYYARVNTLKEPLGDSHVRHALAYATDVQTLIDTVQFGLATVSNCLLPIGSLYWNSELEPYPFDLDKAKEELAASSVPDGFSTEVQITTGNSQQEGLATALKDMWSKINVDLTITPLEGAILRQNGLDGKNVVTLGGWTNDMIDPDEIISYFVVPESSQNARTHYENKEAIDLAIAARGELDDEKRKQMYFDIQRLWWEDGPMIYLFNIPYIDVLQSYVKGFHHNPLGAWYFHEVYLDK